MTLRGGVSLQLSVFSSWGRDAKDARLGLRRRSAFHGSIVLTVKGNTTGEVRKRLTELPGVASVSVVETDLDRMTVRIFPDDPAVPVADRVIASVGRDGVTIGSVFVEQGRLDDVFRDITTGQGMPNP